MSRGAFSAALLVAIASAGSLAAGDSEQLERRRWLERGWERVARATVENPAGEVEAYPVALLVPLDALAPSSRREALDVRFVDLSSGRSLAFWREGRRGDGWRFWVRIDRIGAGERLAIAVVSGAGEIAGGSRPGDVFPFFDGFDSGEIDRGRWSVIEAHGEARVGDGVLRLSTKRKARECRAELVRPLEAGRPVAIEARARARSAQRGGVNITGAAREPVFRGVGSELGLHRGFLFFGGPGAETIEGRWYRLRYRLWGTRAEGEIEDDSGKTVLSRSAKVRARGERWLRLAAWQDGPGDAALSSYEFDWVLLRPLRYPEPRAAMGSAPAPGGGPDPAGRLLVPTGDPTIERAAEIARADILANRTIQAGGLGFRPGGSYDGIWLTDCTFLLEAYRFWGPDYRDFLYLENDAARGIVPRFAERQDTDGLIPMVFWGARGEVDYGGRYDLAQGRKQNRDMESPYTFVHLNHEYWRDTGDATFLARYRVALRRALAPIEARRDRDTGLILATYGPPNADNCVDFALPRTTAHPYFNALYVRAYLEYAEIAEALGDPEEAEAYRGKGERLRAAMNRRLWVERRHRYETRIVRPPVTTDERIGAAGAREDTRFPVVDNMLLLYYGIPDRPEKIAALVEEIERSERGLALAGQMVEPPYPDGFVSRVYTGYRGGNYHNGDVWTWFSNRYATALYRLGYPERGWRVLRAQAAVAARDEGFSEFYEDDAVGEAKGAFPYAPTAASYQLALVEGLFGVEWDAPARRLAVHPSLEGSGSLTARVGGAPLTVSLERDGAGEQIELALATRLEARGDFRVLLRPGSEGGAAWRVEERRAGGPDRAVDSLTRRVGRAMYVFFERPISPGRTRFEIASR